jgi:hypothetical protein
LAGAANDADAGHQTRVQAPLLDLGQDPVIASISLGAGRRFQLKHRRSGEGVAVDLPHAA